MCSKDCTKITLIVFVVLSLIGGIVLVAYGAIWVRWANEDALKDGWTESDKKTFSNTFFNSVRFYTA